ncbi:MAG TPA: helix-turn-helix domain-containing protein [Caulobacteraceae bacterium]|nr:helix-turn-helix domain-containing protein [Caulobacteraceae bacterium]
MPKHPLSPQRRSPKQARAKATVAAILEAAAQILERRGADGLTTNGVAERAGVSIGTLYQYFPDKHAILIAAAKRELAEATAPRRATMQALIELIERLGAAPQAIGGARKQRVYRLRRSVSGPLKRLIEALSPAPLTLIRVRRRID